MKCPKDSTEILYELSHYLKEKEEYYYDEFRSQLYLEQAYREKHILAINEPSVSKEIVSRIIRYFKK